MTVIAWDGKVLAADRQSTQSGLKRTVTKIRRVGKTLLGACGEAVLCKEVLDWISAGAEPDKMPPTQKGDDWVEVIMITPDSKVWFFGRSPTPVQFHDPIAAFGSGSKYALGAMFVGATAKQAVAVACHFDADCGMGIDELPLEAAEDAPDACSSDPG